MPFNDDLRTRYLEAIAKSRAKKESQRPEKNKVDATAKQDPPPPVRPLTRQELARARLQKARETAREAEQKQLELARAAYHKARDAKYKHKEQLDAQRRAIWEESHRKGIVPIDEPTELSGGFDRWREQK